MPKANFSGIPARNYGMIHKFPVITGTANFMETYLKLCKLCIFDVKLKLSFFIFLDLQYIERFRFAMSKHKLRSNNLPKERDAKTGRTVHITLFMY